MGFFQDLFRFESREQRYANVSALLARNGFTSELPPRDVLAPFLPWMFSNPDRTTFHARGEVQGATVDVYEYEYSSTDADGNSTTHQELIAMAWHPRIVGGARLYPDGAAWGGLDASIDALLWLPPFVLIRGIAWALRGMFGTNYPDRNVGHHEFDRLYIVNAPTDEDAQRAIPPALRDTLLRMSFRGSIELRQGLVIVRVPGASLHVTKLGLLMEPLPWLLSAVIPRQGPYR